MPRFLLINISTLVPVKSEIIKRMKRIILFLSAFVWCLLSFTSCMEKFVDLSGISIKSVDVEVEYTEAKVYGEIQIQPTAPKITGIVISYGLSEEDLSKTIPASYDATNGYSADIRGLEDGMEYFFRVDVLVGKATASSEVNSFITFPVGPVDLDLPSGNKWASHNIGASKPTDAGSYYAWGEIREKANYDWDTYAYYQENGGFMKFTKYTTKQFWSYSGVPDNLTELETEDDVANTLLGPDWKIPSYRDWEELRNNCVITKAKINGIVGVRISSKAERNNTKKFIFLPSQYSYYDGTSIVKTTTSSYYWSSTLASSQYGALNVEVTTSAIFQRQGGRYLGETIRPICK